MAIEKRRMQQRYGTYEQFQSDLQNILDHEFISVDSGDTTLEGTTKGLYFKFPGGNPVRIYTTNEMENYNNKFNYYSVGSGGDLDTKKDTGFYNFAGVNGYSNIPDGQTSKINGTLLVVNHKFTTSTDVWNIEQYWFSPTNEVFARTYSYNEQFSSGSWTSWILIATDINNIVEDINIKLNKKENVSNKTSNIQAPSIDSYPNTKAVWDYVESKLTQPLSDITDLQNRTTTLESKSTAFNTRITDMQAGKENASNKKNAIDGSSVFYPSNIAVKNYVTNELIAPKAEIESLKSNKLDKTDFNTYKTATNKAVADNTESIKANTTAIDKCVSDIANNSALINQNAIKVTTDRVSSVLIDDSSNSNIVNLTAYGNSTQSEVPMPTAPVSINDISGVNLYAYGKNLLDFDNTTFRKFRITDIVVDKVNKTISFTSNNDDLSGFFIKNMFIKKGLKGNITTSLVVTTDSECQVHFMASSLEQGLKTISAGSTRLQVQGSIELGKDFWVYVKGQNHSITVSDIQIELGDTATEYEDFNNVQTIKISDVVLRSVDNVCDKIIINKNGDGYIERNIGVINLKNIPKEQWMKSGQNVDRYYAPLTISYNIQDYSKLLCTHFKKESNNDGEAIGKITSNSTNIGFAFAEKDTTTMEDWVSFINNNDVLLYYILSTPTVTQLTQEQVNNVLNIKTNYQNTTILSNCDFQLSYVADTKHYIDNKFNELATALVAHESEVN